MATSIQRHFPLSRGSTVSYLQIRFAYGENNFNCFDYSEESCLLSYLHNIAINQRIDLNLVNISHCETDLKIT